MHGRIGGCRVDREDVQVESEPVDVLPLFFDADGAAVHDLGIAGDEPGLGRVGIVQAPEGSPVAVQLHEPFEIRPRHHDVDVVVPGNEAFVAHGSEKGPVGEGITQVVFAAESVHIREDAEQRGMDFFQVQRFHPVGVLNDKFTE